MWGASCREVDPQRQTRLQRTGLRLSPAPWEAPNLCLLAELLSLPDPQKVCDIVHVCRSQLLSWGDLLGSSRQQIQRALPFLFFLFTRS